MSTKITEIYNALGTFLDSQFTTHDELVNPYFIELNDELTFEKAYGFVIGTGENPNLTLGCNQFSMQRDLQIILTRKIFTGAQMRNANALEIRKDAEKNLFEDQIQLIKAMNANPTLSEDIVDIVYSSDDGIELVSVGKYDLIYLRSNFIIRYIEGV